MIGRSDVVPLTQIQSEYQQWLSTNSYQASRFVQEVPQGPIRDGLALEITKHLSAKEPETALVWAESIENAEQRDGALKVIAATMDAATKK